ncbi:LamG-like jellyroll fold domain-containing protein [Lentzea sp. NPDC005914]|uniref:LamG-like jellyroll fold domain-containing protein n=1 Tax=Lentzea sp. NPDC005914 TaxID=3154572 RepID=UPI0034097C7C
MLTGVDTARAGRTVAGQGAVGSTGWRPTGALRRSVGGAKWGAGVGAVGLEFVGGTSAATTSEPVLYTDQSFTVDVWARINDTGTARTVVAQRGSSGVDPFSLGCDGTRWSAEMPNAAVKPSKWWRAKGNAVVNKWTHLVAAYNASARTLSLTVGYQDTADTHKSTVGCVVGWNSTGVLSVGRGSTGESFNGSIDELKTLRGVLARESPKRSGWRLVRHPLFSSGEDSQHRFAHNELWSEPPRPPFRAVDQLRTAECETLRDRYGRQRFNDRVGSPWWSGSSCLFSWFSSPVRVRRLRRRPRFPVCRRGSPR